MKRFALKQGFLTIATVSALLALALGALAAAPAAMPASAALHPKVAIAGDTPIVLRGTGFRIGERVKVVLTHGKTTYKHLVIAGARGGFWIRIRGSLTATCASTSLSAVGSRGSRFSFKLNNDCPPPADTK